MKEDDTKRHLRSDRQTSVGCTQTPVYIEPAVRQTNLGWLYTNPSVHRNGVSNTEERLDTIINSEKYIVSNMAELSDNESDSDDE